MSMGMQDGYCPGNIVLEASELSCVRAATLSLHTDHINDQTEAAKKHYCSQPVSHQQVSVVFGFPRLTKLEYS